MVKLAIDLNLKIIDSDTRVFITRAGKKGHLFNNVSSAHAIGPDLPDLNLDLSERLTGEKQLIAKINRSREIKSFIEKPKSKAGISFIKNISSYSNFKKKSGHAQIEGMVRQYFQDMNSGDIIIIPNPNPFGKAILAELGEIPKFPVKIQGGNKFSEYKFDGRPFGHFAEIPMSQLPRSIIEIARAPVGIAEIRDSRVKEFIFQNCYANYCFDDVFSTKINTTKESFKPIDASVLTAFITMVANNFDVLEGLQNDGNQIYLQDAAFVDVGCSAPNVKLNINSPGFLELSTRSFMPLLTSVMLCVIIETNFDSMAFANGVNIELINSKDDGLRLCDDVHKKTTDMLKFLSKSEEQFKRMCDLLKKTHDAAGIKTEITVNKKP